MVKNWQLFISSYNSPIGLFGKGFMSKSTIFEQILVMMKLPRVYLSTPAQVQHQHRYPCRAFTGTTPASVLHLHWYRTGSTIAPAMIILPRVYHSTPDSQKMVHQFHSFLFFIWDELFQRPTYAWLPDRKFSLWLLEIYAIILYKGKCQQIEHSSNHTTFDILATKNI